MITTLKMESEIKPRYHSQAVAELQGGQGCNEAAGARG